MGAFPRHGQDVSLVISFTKSWIHIGLAAMLAATGVSAAQAQGEVNPSDSFNFPDNFQMLGENDPNNRRATARVNGNNITGTDVGQRVALIQFSKPL